MAGYTIYEPIGHDLGRVMVVPSPSGNLSTQSCGGKGDFGYLEKFRKKERAEISQLLRISILPYI